jgi:hypothetical protein
MNVLLRRRAHTRRQPDPEKCSMPPWEGALALFGVAVGLIGLVIVPILLR